MGDLKSLKKQYDILGEEIKRLEKCEFSHMLFLKVDAVGDLVIYFTDSDYLCTERCVGYIDGEEGSCHIIDNKTRLGSYKAWRNAGMKIDSSMVRFKYKSYFLVKNSMGVFLTSNFSKGNIYNFTDCEACKNCEDKNILRHEHNNRPVLF
jgi:hypothetical protein